MGQIELCESTVWLCHTRREKEEGTVSGLPELDTALRVLLNHCIHNSLPPQLIARSYSYNPAKKLNFHDRGQLYPGYLADFVLVNPKNTEKIQPDQLGTKCKWSPWENQSLTGIPLITWKNGIIRWIHPECDLKLY